MTKFPHVKYYESKTSPGTWCYNILDPDNDYKVLVGRIGFKTFLEAHEAAGRRALAIYEQRCKDKFTLEQLQLNEVKLIHQVLETEGRTIHEVAELITSASIDNDLWVKGFTDAKNRYPLDCKLTTSPSYFQGYEVGERFANHFKV